MPGELQVKSRRMALVALKRLGSEITIMRPDGSETANQLGKKDDTDVTYTEVSQDENAAFYEEDIERPTAAGGRTRQHRPMIALAWNTDAQEGDRIDFTEAGVSYHIENLVDRGMFQRATCVLE